MDTEEPFKVFELGLTHEFRSYDYQFIRGFKGKRKTTHVARGEAGSETSSDE